MHARLVAIVLLHQAVSGPLAAQEPPLPEPPAGETVESEQSQPVPVVLPKFQVLRQNA